MVWAKKNGRAQRGPAPRLTEIEHLGRDGFVFLTGRRFPDVVQAGTVQAVLREEFPKRHFGDAEVPRTLNEVQQFVPGSLGVGKKKRGDRAGVTRQELSVRTAGETMLNLLDDLPGREFPMAGRRSLGDAHQACDLSHLQSQIAAEQKIAGDPRSGVVSIAGLKEMKYRLEDGLLLIAQLLGQDLRPMQPLFERLTFLGHGNASLTVAFPAAEV